MRIIYLTIGWVAGLVIALTYPAIIPLFWLIGLGVSFFIAWITHKTPYRWLFFAFFAFMCGGYRVMLIPQTSDLAQYNQEGSATIEGIIIAEPDIRDDRILIQVDAQTIERGNEPIPTQGRILITIPEKITLAYGDRVRASGFINTPAQYDTFSYADFLAQRGVYSLMQNAIVTVIAPAEWSIGGTLIAIKAQLLSVIQQHLPDPQGALLSGILLGDEDGIAPQIKDAFTRTGSAHIIAISGFNMVLIASITGKIFEKILRRPFLVMVATIVVLFLYSSIISANSAVWRASLMSSLLVIAPILKRQTYVPASLAFTVLGLSLFNPMVLWDISFQLSFFAVLGLVLFTKPIASGFNFVLYRSFPKRIADTLSGLLHEPIVVSLAALSLTLPLTILYFQRISLIALLVNVLVIPAQSIILIGGLVALSITLVMPSLGQLLFWLVMIPLSWTITVIRSLSGLSFAETSLSIDGGLIVIGYLLIGIGAIMQATQPSWAIRLSRKIQQRAVLNLILLFGTGIGILLFGLWASRPDGKLHVWWLDVGHTNAVLIQTPSGAQILVDGGQYPSRLLTALGERMPFYDRELEVVIITQPDEFDTSALVAVLNRYQAGTIITNGQPSLSPIYETILSTTTIYPQVIAEKGTTMTLSDGTEIEFLYPLEQPSDIEHINDHALLVRVRYGEVSLLLTGDLSYEAQLTLVDSGQDLASSVMSLPQHATVRSLATSFLDAVQPQVIILQSDRANRRGDPSLDTLFTLPEVPLFRTDEQGTLHLWTDGHTLWVLPER